jgi:hypothetical protein
VTTTFQNVCEADDVAFHIGQWVFNGIADSGLCCKVYYALWFVFLEGLFYLFAVGYVDAQVRIVLVVGVSG